jgi:hypothetical protein
MLQAGHQSHVTRHLAHNAANHFVVAEAEVGHRGAGLDENT